MARPSMQFILCGVIATGVLFCIIQYISQTKNVQYSTRCKEIESVCQSQEQAISCDKLEYCQSVWKSYSMGKNKTDASGNATIKLDIKVYYETFCSDSENFIIEQLFPTFKKLYSSGVFSLSMIPYGNAEERRKDDKWVFSCQHGANECLGNLIETCAIHSLKNTTKWLPFIYCMEKKGSTPHDAVKCAKKEGFDYSIVKTCVDGPLGNDLEHEMALETVALTPKHTFIPWITIDGESLDIQKRALKDFFGLVCSMYRGKKPESCQQ